MDVAASWVAGGLGERENGCCDGLGRWIVCQSLAAAATVVVVVVGSSILGHGQLGKGALAPSRVGQRPISSCATHLPPTAYRLLIGTNKRGAPHGVGATSNQQPATSSKQLRTVAICDNGGEVVTPPVIKLTVVHSSCLQVRTATTGTDTNLVLANLGGVVCT